MTEPTSHVPPIGATASMPPVEHHEGERSPVFGDLEVEKPRTHPLTYAALALATLALLLSIAALSRDDGGEEYREVRIGSNDCVIGEAEAEGDDDADVLYCRAANLP